jgi:membrane fusion protein (multidrug efflux system)
VEELQGSYRIYVVEEGDVVRVKTVKVGPKVGPLWLIAQGLSDSDRLVVEGRQKVKDGTRVKPQATVVFDDGSVSAPEKPPVEKPPEAPAPSEPKR